MRISPSTLKVKYCSNSFNYNYTIETRNFNKCFHIFLFLFLSYTGDQREAKGREGREKEDGDRRVSRYVKVRTGLYLDERKLGCGDW